LSDDEEGRDNRNLIDDNQGHQPLDDRDIQRLRDEGLTGRQIVQELVKNRCEWVGCDTTPVKARR
jgi:hypothetical protein